MAKAVAADDYSEGEGQRADDWFGDGALADQLEQETPTAPSTPPQEPAAAPEEPVRQLDWVADTRALQQAHGDPNVWAHEMAGLIHAITGQYIDDSTLVSWLNSYARQIEARTFRDALFQVANTPLPPHPQGDPAFMLLQLRDEIARGFRVAAGAN